MAIRNVILEGDPMLRKKSKPVREVTDHIRLTYTGSDKVETIVGNNKETIGAEVLADEVLVAEPAGYTKEWKINGEEASLGVEKV